MAAMVRNFGGSSKVIRAEAIAAREGLRLAFDLGIRTIILEGDAKLIFDSFEKSSWIYLTMAPY